MGRMDHNEIDLRLSQIETDWKMVLEASQGTNTPNCRALQTFFDQYSRAVYRYLLGAVKDPDAADELFQEFALRISRGSFRGADQSRGLFRKYLKSALINLVIEHHRQASKKPGSLSFELGDTRSPEEALEAEFLKSWREELLSRAWNQLQTLDQQKSRNYYDVLRQQTQKPDLTSTEAAERLNEQLQPQRPFTPTGLRKQLQRARETFADLLLTEVSLSLHNPSVEELEGELIELELDPYCRSALRRRKES